MQSTHTWIISGRVYCTSKLHVPCIVTIHILILIYLRDKQWHNNYLNYLANPYQFQTLRTEQSKKDRALALFLRNLAETCTWRGNVAMYIIHTTLAFVPRMSEIWQVWQQSRLRVPWLALAEPSPGSVGARSHWEANRVLLYWQKRYSLSGLSWASKFTRRLNKSLKYVQYI